VEATDLRGLQTISLQGSAKLLRVGSRGLRTDSSEERYLQLSNIMGHDCTSSG